MNISKKITERVKSFEDACKVLGIDKNQFLQISSNIPQLKTEIEAYMAFIKMTIIAQALNEGWLPDWTNYNEYKYYPWFYQKKEDKVSGLGLSYYDFGCTLSFTTVGSRLVFKTRELAEYAGKQFTEIYNQFLLKK